MDAMPRIKAAEVVGPMTLQIAWKQKPAADQVDLTGWIVTGGETLAALRKPEIFARARIENYGAAVAWDSGDLAIDAVHLDELAREQRPFGADDARAWQEQLGLSNNEAATLLHISLSSWTGYKASSRIPAPVAMLCRAMLRDPVLLQAHLRPRRPGRPPVAKRAAS